MQALPGADGRNALRSVTRRRAHNHSLKRHKTAAGHSNEPQHGSLKDWHSGFPDRRYGAARQIGGGKGC
jgi:hypothetical protein